MINGLPPAIRNTNVNPAPAYQRPDLKTELNTNPGFSMQDQFEQPKQPPACRNPAGKCDEHKNGMLEDLLGKLQQILQQLLPQMGQKAQETPQQ